jgi:hypothetical protein
MKAHIGEVRGKGKRRGAYGVMAALQTASHERGVEQDVFVNYGRVVFLFIRKTRRFFDQDFDMVTGLHPVLEFDWDNT